MDVSTQRYSMLNIAETRNFSSAASICSRTSESDPPPPYNQQTLSPPPYQSSGSEPRTSQPTYQVRSLLSAVPRQVPRQRFNDGTRVETTLAVSSLRTALKGFRCDYKTLIHVFTNPKFAHPSVMMQLRGDYNRTFIRDLEEDIQKSTNGPITQVLLALIRGPLEGDADMLKSVLDHAYVPYGLHGVLLDRSNSHIQDLPNEYTKVVDKSNAYLRKHGDPDDYVSPIRGRVLRPKMKSTMSDETYKLYRMVLTGTRSEEGPVDEETINYMTHKLQHAIERSAGLNLWSVYKIITGCNNAQLRALVTEYQQVNDVELRTVLEANISGEPCTILTTILDLATSPSQVDARWLKEAFPESKSVCMDQLIHRVVMLYFDPPRLRAAKSAYRQMYGTGLQADMKRRLKGHCQDILVRLAG